MEHHFLGSSSGKFPGATESLGALHLPRNSGNSGNSGWGVNGTYFYRAFHGKISGNNWKIKKKMVLFFLMECSRRKFVFLRGGFSANVKTDLYKW